MVDRWLAGVYEAATGGRPPAGIALVAVGGYGRGELAPQSDLDLVLIHDGKAKDKQHVPGLAERIWYPIWDQGLKLGHSVRTVAEALKLAGDDLDTATSLLDVRHLAGDPSVSHDLAARATGQWRKDDRRWLVELGRSVADRHQTTGEVAFLLEPNVKSGRGGLRDVHALGWARAAGVELLAGDEQRVAQAYAVLLDSRVELHRRTGRPMDVLLLEEQDGVAAALGQADADALMAQVSSAGRTIAWVSDETWFRGGGSVGRPRTRRWRAEREAPAAAVAPGLALVDGEIQLTAGSTVETDPLVLLRAAVAAAEAGARLGRDTLTRLQVSRARLPDPWPVEGRELLVRFLATGAPFIDVVEALDQFGLWVRLLPEWEPNRCRPQRNAYHRFTVDRHLWEAAANAADLLEKVDRADLLLVGALLHDVGKGYPGDHTQVGIELISTMAPRLGFDAGDTAVLVDMCRHHLLLPDAATRRDLDEDATIIGVADAVGDRRRLHLLEALTQADSLATGPAAWGSWKAYLVHELVRRVDHVLAGGDVEEVAGGDFPTVDQQALLQAGELVIRGGGNELTVVSPDRPGLFSRVAGVLALHGLGVVGAGAHSQDGMALEFFQVRSQLAREIDWAQVAADVERAINGRLAVQARLAERSRTYARRPTANDVLGATAPRVEFDNDGSTSSTVVEVHAPDGLGLLYRLTLALSDLDIDIDRALVQTLGHNVVDTFYVRDVAGRKLTDAAHLAEVERAVLHAISAG